MSVEEIPQSGEPVQFEQIFLGTHGLSIGHINIDHSDRVNSGGNQPALRSFIIIGQPTLDIAHRQERENGHAIIGLLAESLDSITELLEFSGGKFLVDTLNFLQTNNIWAIAPHPFEYAEQTCGDRIDIPCSDFHLFYINSIIYVSARQKQEKHYSRLSL